MTPVFIPEGDYYTIPEVAKLLGEERRTVNNWLKLGRLRGVKTGIGWLVLADGLEGFTPPKPGPKPSAQQGNAAELLPPFARDVEDDAWVKGTQIP